MDILNIVFASIFVSLFAVLGAMIIFWSSSLHIQKKIIQKIDWVLDRIQKVVDVVLTKIFNLK